MQTAIKAAPAKSAKAVKANPKAAKPEAESKAPEAATAAPTVTAPAKPTAADKRAEYIETSNRAAALIAMLSASTVSVPVKPATFKAQPLNAKARDLSERGAAALFFAIAASGKPLADGGTYARTFNLAGKAYRIENGAFSDFAGRVYTVQPGNGLGDESFTLQPGASKRIAELLGANAKAFLAATGSAKPDAIASA